MNSLGEDEVTMLGVLRFVQPDDLIYGPGAGRKLRELQEAAGGRLLTDLSKPPGMSIRQFTVCDASNMLFRQQNIFRPLDAPW